MDHAPIPEEDEELARRVIGAAIEVHRILGPGFLESVYRRALCHELSLQRIPFEYEKELLVPYKDIRIPGNAMTSWSPAAFCWNSRRSKPSRLSTRLSSFLTSRLLAYAPAS
jgi:hypothetical protein